MSGQKELASSGYGIGKQGYSPPPELMCFLENCGVWEIRLSWIMTVRLLAAMYQLFMCVNWSVEVVLCHFGNCCCNFLTFLAIVFLRPVSTHLRVVSTDFMFLMPCRSFCTLGC